MSKKPTSQLTSLDDKLAEFADQVLGGQISPSTDLVNEDQEMRSLAQMVMLMSEEFGSDQPSPDMAERIKAKLVTEWQRSDLSGRTTNPGRQWWQRLIPGRIGYRQQQIFTFALVAITVIVLVIVMLSPLSTGGTFTGAAGADENTPLLPILLLLGVAMLSILAWFLRRRL